MLLFFFYTESLNTSFFILEFYIRIILGVLVNCQRSSGAIFDPMVTRQLRSRSSRCPDQRFLCFTMYGTGYSWHVLSWTEPDFPRPLAFQGYRFIWCLRDPPLAGFLSVGVGFLPTVCGGFDTRRSQLPWLISYPAHPPSALVFGVVWGEWPLECGHHQPLHVWGVHSPIIPALNYPVMLCPAKKFPKPIALKNRMVCAISKVSWGGAFFFDFEKYAFCCPCFLYVWFIFWMFWFFFHRNWWGNFFN